MDDSTPNVKKSFSEISQPYRGDEHILHFISKTADVQVMLKMIKGTMVRRADAEKVLVAFSEYTKQTWNLTNVRVALIEEGEG